MRKGAEDIEAYIDTRFKKRFIIRFCLGLVAVSLISSIMFFLLIPESGTGFYSSFISDFSHAREMLGVTLFLIGVFETLAAGLFTLIIALFVSHKVGGPLFKLERKIKKLKNRELLTPPVSFRSNDQGSVLAEKFNEMLRSWHASFVELKHDFYEFSISMDLFQRSWMQEGETGHDVDAVAKVRHYVKKMEAFLDHFHTP